MLPDKPAQQLQVANVVVLIGQWNQRTVKVRCQHALLHPVADVIGQIHHESSQICRGFIGFRFAAATEFDKQSASIALRLGILLR